MNEQFKGKYINVFTISIVSILVILVGSFTFEHYSNKDFREKAQIVMDADKRADKDISYIHNNRDSERSEMLVKKALSIISEIKEPDQPKSKSDKEIIEILWAGRLLTKLTYNVKGTVENKEIVYLRNCNFSDASASLYRMYSNYILGNKQWKKYVDVVNHYQESIHNSKDEKIDKYIRNFQEVFNE